MNRIVSHTFSNFQVSIIGQKSGYKVGDRIQFRMDHYDGQVAVLSVQVAVTRSGCG